MSFWESIKTSTDAEDFKAYLESYPTGRFAALARNNMRRLEAAAKAAASNSAANTSAPVRPPAGNAAANTTGAARPAGRPQQMVNRAGVKLVWIPAGSFMMGSESDSDEKPMHRVTISEGFFMGKYEVTHVQWQTMKRYNPSYLRGDSLPVENVSWDDAVGFIAKLNGQKDGYTYRLPTEAEWEYACRAGTTGDYACDLDSMAWYYNNAGDARLSGENNYYTVTGNNNRTHPVGSKQPNAFGLFDMHGNVWEWCQDWYHDSYAGAPTDGSAWLSGGEQKSRVLRGGSWYWHAVYLRSAHCGMDMPEDRGESTGFRIVASARSS